MATFAFVNGKGGVGKSITTLNAGVALSRMAYEVVAVDVDLDTGNFGRHLDGADTADDGIESVLAGDLSLSDAIVEGPDGLSVLPARADRGADGDASATDLPDLFRRLEEEFEFVVVDTPPGLRDALPVSVGTADWSLVVTTTSVASRTNAEQTVELVEMSGGTVLGAVVSRVTAGADVDAVEAALGSPVVGVIPEDPALDESPVVAERDSDPDTAAAGFWKLAHFLEVCRTADDPLEAARAFEPPPVPSAETEAETEAVSVSASANDSVEDMLGGSGTQLGSARDADYHLDQMQDAIDRTDDDTG